MYSFLSIVLLLGLSTNIVCAELTEELSAAAAAADHVTASVRIQRSCIPKPVIQCLSYQGNNKSSQQFGQEAHNCPLNINDWNNVHCVNNSFGLYTSGAQFMSFGAGPFGVNFNPASYDPFNFFSGQPPGHSKQEFESKKIEGLIVDKAQLQVKMAFLQERLNEIEKEKEQLEIKLKASEKGRLADLLKIQTLGMRLSRWEEGTIECQGDVKRERNKSSVALQIASSHIQQLQEENDAYIKTNKQLSEVVAELQVSSDKSRDTSLTCHQNISACRTSLGFCEDSEREMAKSLEQRTQAHDTYVTENENEYKKVRDNLHHFRLTLSECTASSHVAKNHNADLRKSRDECIERLSRDTNKLHNCNEALSNCHTNSSISSDRHENRRNQIEQCSDRIIDVQAQYQKCESDKHMIKNELFETKQHRQELIALKAIIASQLDDVNRTNAKLEGHVAELVKRINDERDANDETKSKFGTCRTELGGMSAKMNILKEEAAEANGSIHQLQLSKASYVKENHELMKQVVIITSRLKIMEANSTRCGKQVTKYQHDNSKLLSTATTCQGHLDEAQHMYAVVVNQRDACSSHQSAGIQKLDQWKEQYMTCGSEVRDLKIKLKKCESGLDSMQVMYKSLKEEAETVHQVSENSDMRLRESTKTILKLTISLSNLETKAKYLENDKAELTEDLAEKQHTLGNVYEQYMDCSSRYNQSVEFNSALQRNTTFISEMLAVLKKQAKETTDQLIDAQTSLSQQSSLHTKTKNQLTKLETKLNAAKELYDNEHRMKVAVAKQLRHCTHNHTEVVGESQQWQQQLVICREHMNNLISAHQRELEQIEMKMEGMADANGDAMAAARKMTNAITQCKNEQEVLLEEKADLQHQLGEYVQIIQVNTIKIRHITNIKIRLTRKLDMYTLKFSKCDRLRKIHEERYKRCSEVTSRLNADIDIIHSQLEQCNENCGKTSLTCPEASRGETYVIMGSGCLLQTHHSGPADEMKEYCKEAGGQLLTLQPSDESLHQDITSMLMYSDMPAEPVWVLRPDQDYDNCFSVDISSIQGNHTDPVKYIATPCTEKLPGICFSELSQFKFSSTSVISHTMGSLNSNTTFSDFDDFNIPLLDDE